MGDNTKIEWTDASWTPLRARHKETKKTGWHCEKVSAGCDNCYSATFNQDRFGTGLPFKPGHRKDIDIFLDESMLMQPLRWKRPRRIFVCSMTDLFGDFHIDEWIDMVFAVMALCPQHTFQILTKRSRRMRELLTSPEFWVQVDSWAVFFVTMIFTDAGLKHWGHLDFSDLRLPNVHLGVSCEDQTRADERIPDLLATPAAVRFVSAEPLLGPIDVAWALSRNRLEIVSGFLKSGQFSPGMETLRPLDQIIVGGESGSGFRPMQMEWAEAIMRQCRDAGTAFFFKQDSGPRSSMRGRASDELWSMKQMPVQA